MKSYSYDSLCQRIGRMPNWKVAALCAVCADKVTPIIAGLGLPSTWHLVETCLEFVWTSVAHATETEDSLQLIQALEATPEWECEDSSYLPFVVTKALDFVGFALRAASSHSPKELAEKALSLLAEVAENFDTSTTRFPDEQTIKSLGVQLRNSEELSQERLISTLESATSPTSQFITALRQEATSVSELFKKLLPIYCYYYVQG